MKIDEIDLADGFCQECYKEFETGDAIGFRLTKWKHPSKPNTHKLELVHMEHLIRHRHAESTVYES